jgi:hypothetical protein
MLGQAVLLSLALLGACAAPAPRIPAPAPQTVLPRGPVLSLPPEWATQPVAAFEAWVLREFPEDRATPISKPGLRELAAALDRMDQSSVRAAVILSRSLYVSNAAVMIRRLERREFGPERSSDCGDTLLAAGLARFPDPRRYARRLVPLAVGPSSHPDLEVRVECAATALHAGYEQVIPFLLQVLRIDTFAGLSDQRDFVVSPTTAWARGRAAEALSTYAGVPLSYRTDGPIAHREQEAARLAELLLPAPVVPDGHAPE